MLDRRKFEERVLKRIRWTTQQKVFFLLIMAVGFVTTYALLELALRTCGGVSNGGLPSMTTVIAGLALIAVVEGVVGLVLEVIAALSSHHHG
jgi:hypothetical protein